ncbi:hypothetical protein [Pseudoalteromonas aurantia]|nr:hypothetical protein [Pseudoalteromonas aurantia]
MKKKIRNWSQYNRALVQRGNINIWLSDSATSKWQVKVTAPERSTPIC